MTTYDHDEEIRGAAREIVYTSTGKSIWNRIEAQIKELRAAGVPEEKLSSFIRLVDEEFLSVDHSVKHMNIYKPPAHFFVSIAQFLLSKAAYQRYIEPHIQDIRLEHYEALQAGELHRAHWIVIRGYCQALWPIVVAAWATITALRHWAK